MSKPIKSKSNLRIKVESAYKGNDDTLQGLAFAKNAENIQETIPLYANYKLDEEDYEKQLIAVGLTEYISPKQHDALLLYITEQLNYYRATRQQLINKKIDLIENAYHAVSIDGLDDCQIAEVKNHSETNNFVDYLPIPLLNSKVNDIATHFANILCPPTALYATVATADKMHLAKAVAGKMSAYGKRYGHYSAFHAALLDCVRYNLCAIQHEWTKTIGTKLQTPSQQSPTALNANVNAANGLKAVSAVVAEGSKLTTISPRNLVFDASVRNIATLADEGLFVGKVTAITMQQIFKEYNASNMFGNLNINMISPIFYGHYNGKFNYYHLPKPMRSILDKPGGNHHHKTTQTKQELTLEHLTGVSESAGFNSVDGQQELLEIYIKLCPKIWGLAAPQDVKETDLQLYKMLILNGEQIVYLQPYLESFGAFPIVIASLNSDTDSSGSERSIAELVLPYQQHTTDLIVKHQRALQKGILGGLTIYDKDTVDLSQVNKTTGMVAAKATREMKDLRASVLQLNQIPDTSRALEHIEGLSLMLERMIPSDTGKQITDLNRATEMQAAAAIQSGSKRWLGAVKLLDDNLFSRVRQLIYNSLLNNEKELYISDANSQEKVLVSAAELLQADIGFDINNGLLGFDRVIQTQYYIKLFQMLIQSNAASQYNITDLIDYITSLFGDQNDFNAFKVKTALDNLPPEMQQQAAEMFMQAQQQAEAEGQNPEAQKTQPQQQTSPIALGNFAN